MLRLREGKGDHPIESASVNYAEEELEMEIKSWFCGGDPPFKSCRVFPVDCIPVVRK